MPPAMKRAKKDPTILAQEWQTWSPLANTLLTLWGQGEISAPTVQKIAHAAKLSGCTSQDVQSFASIGAFGKHHQNCHRDLIRKMPQSLVPESLPVTCNVKDSKATSVDVRQIPLKLPCLWMHHLSTELDGTLLFQGFFGTLKLADFWSKVDLKGPRWKGHTFMTKPNWKHKCIPLVIHGDGAEFQNNDSLFSISFKGLLNTTDDFQENLWITSIPKRAAFAGAGDVESTHQTIWKWVSWSLKALFHNKWPAKDPWGHDILESSALFCKVGLNILPDGFFCVLIGILGDMEFFQNELGLNHQGSHTPCHLCKCNRDGIPWNDFSSKAAWRATQKDGAQKSLTHPLFKVPGVTAHSTCLDVLHVMDLGFTSHCLGNIIFDLVVYILPGSRQQNLKEVWTFIQSNQRESDHGKQLSHFTLQHFCNTSKIFKTYPQMHHLKAAQCRMLVPVVYQLAHHFLKGTTACEKKESLMHNLDMWYNFIYEQPMVPNPARAKEAIGYMNKALQCYQWLAADAVDKGKCMWSMVPKHHYSAEMAHQGFFLNPRFVWTYGSEDYVGKLSELGASCMRGVSSFHVPFLMDEKYSIFQSITLAVKA